MRQWFFENIPTFRPEVGFATEFIVESPERTFLHQWKITEVEPPQRIVYYWLYGGYPGESYVTFQLSGMDSGTHLRITHAGVESFPQEVPEFTKQSCQEGWDYFIGNRLKTYLDGSDWLYTTPLTESLYFSKRSLGVRFKSKIQTSSKPSIHANEILLYWGIPVSNHRALRSGDNTCRYQGRPFHRWHRHRNAAIDLQGERTIA